MKVAVLSESHADEAAVRILVEALVGEAIDAPSSIPPIRSRGWPAVRNVLAPVLKHLHYHSDTEAFVVVVDSDFSLVHHPGHVQQAEVARKCRLCELREVVNDAQRCTRRLEGREPIKIALGLAVPAIEAWYLAGLKPQVTESAWIVGMQDGRYPYTKNDLKSQVYGTDRPPIALETERAVEQAQRLAVPDGLQLLENFFPAGFGSLAADVRRWQIG